MKQLQKRIKSGAMDARDDDPFDLFIAATDIRYSYYSESYKILGSTFGMCVLQVLHWTTCGCSQLSVCVCVCVCVCVQDFEALTPNLLARTVETVEGGGIIVILLRSLTSLRQLVTMTMDVHARFRTESHQDVFGRFNERCVCVIIPVFLLSVFNSTHVICLISLFFRTDFFCLWLAV